MNERPDLYEYQQTIFKRFNMKKKSGSGRDEGKIWAVRITEKVGEMRGCI